MGVGKNDFIFQIGLKQKWTKIHWNFQPTSKKIVFTYGRCSSYRSGHESSIKGEGGGGHGCWWNRGTLKRMVKIMDKPY